MPAKLVLVRQNNTLTPSQWDAWTFKRTVTGTNTGTITIGLPDRTVDVFTYSGSTITPVDNPGAVLTGSGSSYTYTDASGVAVTFTDLNLGSGGLTSFCGSQGTATDCNLLPVSILAPSGASTTFAYDTVSYPGVAQGSTPVTAYAARLSAIQNSFGMKIRFRYVSDTTTAGAPPSTNWQTRKSAQFFNLNVDATNPQASVVYTVSGGTTSIQTPDNETTGVTDTAIQLPQDTSPQVSVTTTSGQVTAATNAGVTTGYSLTTSGSQKTVTKTNALGGTTSRTYDTTLGIDKPLSLTDENGNTTTYEYWSDKTLKQVTFPEGNKVKYTRDSRGNVTETRWMAKPSVGGADIVSTAVYPSACTNTKICNLPTSTTDALGRTTTYTYVAATGELDTVTGPRINGVAGTEAQVRYSYTTINSTSYLTGVSQCVKLPAGNTGLNSCVGTADEIKLTIGYDAAGNRTSVTTANGTGSLSATTTMGYDSQGNLTSVDGPLTGTDDTTTYRYNARNKLVGIVYPDPDGSGSLKRLARRIGYTPAGDVKLIDQGTVNGTSDTDWNAFAIQNRATLTYDAQHRVTLKSLSSGSTTYAVLQYNYDELGRAKCTAVRMNMAATLPTDACTLGTAGTDGPDRISQNVWDAASQLLSVTSAYGTSDVGADYVAQYNANGTLKLVKDGESNRTTYEYDGFDRLVKTRYPIATKSADTSSTLDYEALTYDATGNVKSFRSRRDETITFDYDEAGRLVKKTVPERTGLDATNTRDVYYIYDLASRMTDARFDSTTGEGITFAYDALGRVTSTTQAMDGTSRTLSYLYDLAGRRTRITWPDTRQVSYNYDLLNRPTTLTDSGSATIRSYAYTDAGAVTETAGGVVTGSYGVDNLGRLSSIGRDLVGTSSDVSTSLTYNPASQIKGTTRDNDAYAWNGHYNLDLDYVSNGRNQYASAGSVTFTYDVNRNLLSSDGVNNFTYDIESHLVKRTWTGGNSTSLRYDPLGRLYEVVNGANTTRLLYDGSDLVAEYDASGTMLRRYAHGVSAGDDPIVWYEGGGMNATSRRYLFADERGSITNVTDSAGNSLTINTYDEYGLPGTANAGRFQYTGQAYFAELGLYHYKARMYSPTLGRFLQTDPIGYADGLNLYNYVHGDPVNGVDPSGAFCMPLMNHYSYQYYDYNNNGRRDAGEDAVPNSVRYEGSSGGYCTGAAGLNAVRDRGGIGNGGGGGSTKAGDCAQRASDGTCIQRRNKNGKLEITEEWKNKVCSSAANAQATSSAINDTLGFPPTTAGAAAAGAKAGGSAGAGSAVAGYTWLVGLIAQTTTGQGWSPFGFNVVPKADLSMCGPE